jgi:hypothetical protein
MTWYPPGYTNRLRRSDYLRLFKASGFRVKKLKTTREYLGDLSKLKIARKFGGYSYEELKILAFWVLIQKENRNET